MKKMAMVLLCVMVLSSAIIVNESAATTANPDWFNCTMQSAGVVGAFGFVFVTSAGTGGTTPFTTSTLYAFDATTVNGKAMLAAALTAYASGGAVALYFPGAGITAPAAGAVPGAIGAGAVS